MFLYTVIPIQRGIPFDTASYYGAQQLSAGALVWIPFGKQTIMGLVVEATPLVDAKLSVKNATFSLKKIKEVIGSSVFTETLLESVALAQKKLLAPKGVLASLFLHEIAVECIAKDVVVPTLPSAQFTPPVVVLGMTEERLDTYKRIIRAFFAEKRSVVFVAPTIKQVEWWYQKLSKGIGQYSVVLHSKRTKKELRAHFATLRQSERPLLICTTPRYAHIAHGSIGAYILEDESSTLYKTNDRFEIDMRILIDALAGARNVPLIYGAILPRFETLIRGEATHIPRSYVPERLMITEVASYKSTLPTEAIELVRFCQKQKKNLFIYTNRKGLAPLAKCNDCGTIVECPTCTLPITLRYKTQSGVRERLYVCGHCGDTIPATHLCTHCGGWNIHTSAVGTESIYEALLSWVPKEKLFVIDDTVMPDNKEIELLLQDPKLKKGAVLIGTQKLLPYIDHIDYTLIPFFDRIVSTPSPYTVEETLRVLMECNERTKEKVVVCTRHPEFSFTAALASQKIQSLIDEDIEARTLLKYPPFGTLLKLSFTTNPTSYAHVADRIRSYVAEYDFSMTAPRRISLESMKVLSSVIVSVPLSFIEERGDDFVQFLTSLKVPYKLEVNPLRLL